MTEAMVQLGNRHYATANGEVAYVEGRKGWQWFYPSLAECRDWSEPFPTRAAAVEDLAKKGHSDNDRAREGSLPNTAVWANGFGVFHARVPRHAVGPLIAARRLLRDALTERYQDVDPRCWREPVRVTDLDTEDSIVYQERFVDIEGTESE